MSTKAARGTKRACLSCGNKFYDLNRDPITCPICNALFHQTEARPKAVIAGNAVDDEDDDVIAAAPAGVDMVSLSDVEADEADLPDLEDNELVDIEEDAADLGGDDDEAFIAVEDDDDGGDVTGFVGGGRESDEEV
jgi:uncharacterized protein (TIGR02300 family)